jgi:hypothetical protein
LQEKNEQMDVLLNTAERKSNQLEAQRSEITLLRRDIAAAVSFYVYMTWRSRVCERQRLNMSMDGCLATRHWLANIAPADMPDSSSDLQRTCAHTHSGRSDSEHA